MAELKPRPGLLIIFLVAGKAKTYDKLVYKIEALTI
jgi:hypothetical protein